jgi:FlaA1/EpsC-like NDP-sugar epimerase
MIGVGPQRPRLPVSRWWQAAARRSVHPRTDGITVVLDLALVGAAYLIMLVARYEAAVPGGAWAGLRTFLPIAVAVHVAANWAAGLYGPVWKQASIHEAQRLLSAGAAATVLLTLSLLVMPRYVPLSVAIIGGGIATGLFGIARFQSRLFAFRRSLRSDEAARLLIVGAGDSASSLLRELQRRNDVGVQPVGLLDDDPRKLGRVLNGVPILGTTDALAEVGHSLGVDQVLLAIPSATSDLVRRVADATAELGVPLKVLPGVNELVNGRPQLRDVRDLSIDDLLGRQQVRTDLASVAAMIRGRRVLVTGGGGSIGAEIARQVAGYEPSRLVLLDRDETHLFDAAADLEDCVEVLLDVRDRDGVDDLFARERPEIVFHAAANKHVPLLESHPREAVTTNVVGTDNIALAARAQAVEHLVFVSTDKAVNPRSVMGASKRLAERLVLGTAPSGAAWCAVRFGNVLGSRGSVVPTFMRQIRRGGPVTITHPDMTRFFMSIPEAVQLVLQAAALAEDREIFMLDMGEPVRIVDLANRMVALAGLRVGTDIEMRVIGPRPGEKLTEELHDPEEEPSLTVHPKIVRLQPAIPHRSDLEATVGALVTAVRERDDATARQVLFEGHDATDPEVIRVPDVEHATERGSGPPPREAVRSGRIHVRAAPGHETTGRP